MISLWFNGIIFLIITIAVTIFFFEISNSSSNILRVIAVIPATLGFIVTFFSICFCIDIWFCVWQEYELNYIIGVIGMLATLSIPLFVGATIGFWPFAYSRRVNVLKFMFSYY